MEYSGPRGAASHPARTGPLPPRWAGVLLHPTSLPGPGPIGTLGAEAHQWVDWLADAGFTAWQVLPLGPTGAGNSPYSSWSSLLGAPSLIDLRALAEAGLLTEAEARPGTTERVDHGLVHEWHRPMVLTAARRLCADANHPWHGPMRQWVSNNPWLRDIARFAARKEANGWAAWWQWPEQVKSRLPADVLEVDAQLGEAIDTWKALAWLFEGQWAAVRQHAARRGITLIGDMPLYVATDSVEVWARPELFRLDPDGLPAVVAGCPPDAFTPLGQRWGNPMYSWDAHKHEDFQWWLSRLQRLLHRVHVVRIDHFRGLSAGWAIPASAPDARSGRWARAPGVSLFGALQRSLGSPLPLIAEDLGHLDQDVHDLRRMAGIPGMRVLQFGFDGGPGNPHHPDHVGADMVVYPGTHDTDTVAGWWSGVGPSTRGEVEDTLGCSGSEVPLALVHAALDSGAGGAVIAAQDLLSLGSDARTNTPGTPDGNWSWRLTAGQREALCAASWHGALRATSRLSRVD